MRSALGPRGPGRGRLRAAIGLLHLRDRLAGAPPLHAGSLEAAAEGATGLRDFGEARYRDGLERLLSSAENDADLNPFGRELLRRVARAALEARLGFVEARRATPELFEGPLVPPLIVTGLPRTGTTHMHRLLASAPGHRAVPFWQLLTPVSIRSRATTARRRRYAESILRPRRWFLPDFDAVHHIRADAPEECSVMLGLTFESLVFWLLTPVHGYLDWYVTRDRRSKYRDYALLLRAVQASDPTRRLVLKAPAHSDALEALIDALPEAMIVQTHRDVVAATTSWCSLTCALHRVTSREIDVPRAVAGNVALLERLAQRSLEARDRLDSRVVDVHYDELVSEPLAVAQRVHHHFGLPAGADVLRAARRYVACNPARLHGEHRYAPEGFGLEPSDLRARFRDYTSRFLERSPRRARPSRGPRPLER